MLKVVKDKYCYFYRHHSGYIIDVDYNDELRILTFESRLIVNFMLEEEIRETHLFRNDSTFRDLRLDDEERYQPTIVFEKVPEDAILDGSIQRFNLDTPGGKIVEIWVFRKVGRDRNHLKGPIYSNITASTVTKYPQNRNNSIVYQPDFNNNGGTIESDQEERIDGDEGDIPL